LARVVPFKNRRRNRPWIRRRRGRLADAPWPPLAALVVVAGALWLGAVLYPNSGIERQLSQLVGNPASATSGSGGFVLCAGASRLNCVVDGDTIRMGGVKIRLADIDAPEVFSPKCASEAARGRRATQRLLELMNAGPFQLVSGSRDEDRYGRKLRTVERGGRSVGATLVAEGLARRWDGARRGWCG
jgi:micrococcal nuclease